MKLNFVLVRKLTQGKQKLYKMKTKLISLLCLTLLIGSISAQTFEGKITFGIDYELPEAMEAQRSMLPSEMTNLHY